MFDMTGFELTSVPHVWKHPDGRFTYTDETEAPAELVYSTSAEAEAAMNAYNWFVLEGLGERLKHENLVVTFKKSDGSFRTMRCTAQPGAFPPVDTLKEHTTKKHNPEIQVVFDLDKQAIRSFRKDSVIDFGV